MTANRNNQTEYKTAIQTLERMVVARPGGNDTALIFDQIDRTEQAALAEIVQQTYSNIEQVMFVEQNAEGQVYGQMAGGEFCGNAARSLGYVLAQGTDQKLDLAISGATDDVTITVKDGFAGMNMPMQITDDNVQIDPETQEIVVNLGGIAFLVTTPDQRTGAKIMAASNDARQKDIVRSEINKSNLAQELAAGILVVEEIQPQQYRLLPFVYVRETGTLYCETGCASGSAAVGVILNMQGVDMTSPIEIMQPSGMSLYVTLTDQAGQEGTKNIDVNGPVEILFDGAVDLMAEVAA